MSNISDGIEFILAQARAEREKMASSDEKSDLPLDMQIHNTATLSTSMKLAAQHLRSFRTDVTVEDISRLLHALSHED